MAQPDTAACRLRKADERDSQVYHWVRNEESVRGQMFNKNPIDLATHQAWFARKLADPDAFLFVMEIPLGVVGHEPVGYMRIEVEDVSGETSVAVLPEFRNRGYAAWAINEACARVFAERPDMHTVYAHIKPDNAASVRAFTKAGFLWHGGLVDYEGHECIEMIFTRDALVDSNIV